MSQKASSTRSNLYDKAWVQNQTETVDPVDLSLQDARQLIHVLRVRQRELEMQNAALQTAQTQLEKVQRKYRDLCELSPVGLLTLDDEGLILEANLTFADMLEVESSKLIGCSLSDFVAPLAQETYRFFLQRLCNSGQPQQCEIDLVTEDLFVAKLNGEALSHDGEKTTYCVAISNVTVEKQTALAELELAGERHRAKILANFVGNMSHDLRTPLTRIATGLYLVGRISDEELRLKKVSEIETQLFSLAHILEQLQMMAVLDSLVELEKQPEALNSVMASVIEAVKLSADAKGIELITSLEEDLPQVLMNTDNMSLALLNLINNAIQFTPSEGLISLTTQQQDNYVMIEVSDNGIGIPANVLPHIFERFFKADAARSPHTGGAGLGLPLAKRVIELHHGGLEVSSIPDVKTVFRISLPFNQP